MPTVGSTVVRLSATSAAFSADMNKAKAALASFGNVALGVGAKVALALGGTAFLKSQASAIDSTAKLGDRLGIATEQMQAMNLAADLAGVSQEQLAKGVQKMNITLGDATKGEKTAVAAFENLGLKVSELASIPADQAFSKIAMAINALPTPAMKAAAAVDVFGKSGAEMLGFLREVSGGAIESAAKDLGALAVNRDQAARVEAANDAMTRLWTTVKGLANQVVVALSPAFEKVSNVLSKLLKNETFVKAITFAFETLGAVVEITLEIISEGFRLIGGLISSLVGDSLPSMNSGFTSARDVVISVFEGIGVAIAYVTDTIKAIVGVVKIVAAGVVGAFSFVAQGIAQLIKLGAKLPDKLGGKVFAAAAAGVENFALGVRQTAAELAQAGVRDIQSFGQGADRVHAFFDGIRNRADAATQATDKLAEATDEVEDRSAIKAGKEVGPVEFAAAGSAKAQSVIVQAQRARDVAGDPQQQMVKEQKAANKELGAIRRGILDIKQITPTFAVVDLGA